MNNADFFSSDGNWITSEPPSLPDDGDIHISAGAAKTRSVNGFRVATEEYAGTLDALFEAKRISEAQYLCNWYGLQPVTYTEDIRWLHVHFSGLLRVVRDDAPDDAQSDRIKGFVTALAPNNAELMLWYYEWADNPTPARYTALMSKLAREFDWLQEMNKILEVEKTALISRPGEDYDAFVSAWISYAEIDQHRRVGQLLPLIMAYFENTNVSLLWKMRPRERYDALLRLIESQNFLLGFDVPFDTEAVQHAYDGLGVNLNAYIDRLSIADRPSPYPLWLSTLFTNGEVNRDVCVDWARHWFDEHHENFKGLESLIDSNNYRFQFLITVYCRRFYEGLTIPAVKRINDTVLQQFNVQLGDGLLRDIELIVGAYIDDLPFLADDVPKVNRFVANSPFFSSKLSPSFRDELIVNFVSTQFLRHLEPMRGRLGMAETPNLVEQQVARWLTTFQPGEVRVSTGRVDSSDYFSAVVTHSYDEVVTAVRDGWAALLGGIVSILDTHVASLLYRPIAAVPGVRLVEAPLHYLGGYIATPYFLATRGTAVVAGAYQAAQVYWYAGTISPLDFLSMAPINFTSVMRASKISTRADCNEIIARSYGGNHFLARTLAEHYLLRFGAINRENSPFGGWLNDEVSALANLQPSERQAHAEIEGLATGYLIEAMLNATANRGVTDLETWDLLKHQIANDDVDWYDKSDRLMNLLYNFTPFLKQAHPQPSQVAEVTDERFDAALKYYIAVRSVLADAPRVYGSDLRQFYNDVYAKHMIASGAIQLLNALSEAPRQSTGGGYASRYVEAANRLIRRVYSTQFVHSDPAQTRAIAGSYSDQLMHLTLESRHHLPMPAATALLNMNMISQRLLVGLDVNVDEVKRRVAYAQTQFYFNRYEAYRALGSGFQHEEQLYIPQIGHAFPANAMLDYGYRDHNNSPILTERHIRSLLRVCSTHSVPVDAWTSKLLVTLQTAPQIEGGTSLAELTDEVVDDYTGLALVRMEETNRRQSYQASLATKMAGYMTDYLDSFGVFAFGQWLLQNFQFAMDRLQSLPVQALAVGGAVALNGTTRRTAIRTLQWLFAQFKPETRVDLEAVSDSVYKLWLMLSMFKYRVRRVSAQEERERRQLRHIRELLSRPSITNARVLGEQLNNS